jgi:hypothetical protein
MVRLLMVIIPLAMTIYALVDAIQTEDTHIQHLPKLIWIVLILLFPPVGSIVWFIVGRQRGPQSGRSAPRRPTTPLGPDDDPDFLRNL